MCLKIMSTIRSMQNGFFFATRWHAVDADRFSNMWSSIVARRASWSPCWDPKKPWLRSYRKPESCTPRKPGIVQELPRKPGTTSIFYLFCYFGALCLVKCWKRYFQKIRNTILLQFQRVTFRFAYGRSQQPSFL